MFALAQFGFSIATFCLYRPYSSRLLSRRRPRHESVAADEEAFMSEARCAIPVIDLGDALVPGTAHAREVALDLGVACETVGVFHLASHGMSGETLQHQLHLARAAMNPIASDDDAVADDPADRIHLRCIASVGSASSLLTGVEPCRNPSLRKAAPTFMPCVILRSAACN